MNRYKKIVAGMGLCVLMLTGCSKKAMLPEVIEKTTLSIDTEGTVTSYLVDVFDKEYYQLDELRTMVSEDAEAYNKAHPAQSAVTVEAVEKVPSVSNGVMVTYVYSDAESCGEHSGSTLFYGTVSEALEEGYSLTDTGLSDVKDGEELSPGWTEDAAKKHILITDMRAEIYCPYEVSCISGGAVYNENGSVDTVQTDEPVVILMKK